MKPCGGAAASDSASPHHARVHRATARHFRFESCRAHLNRRPSRALPVQAAIPAASMPLRRATLPARTRRIRGTAAGHSRFESCRARLNRRPSRARPHQTPAGNRCGSAATSDAASPHHARVQGFTARHFRFRPAGPTHISDHRSARPPPGSADPLAVAHDRAAVDLGDAIPGSNGLWRRYEE